MSKNIKLNNTEYSGVSTVQLPTTDGGTAAFKDIDEITTPTGTKTITENGTYDVSGYASAEVNVESESGGGSDDVQAVIDSIANGTITEVTSNITTARKNSFADCGSLVKAHFPLLKNVQNGMFSGCKSLIDIYFPVASVLVASSFSNCTSLVKADFPLIESINQTVFNGCTSLKHLVLRVEKVCVLNNVNVFTNTPIANGEGWVYVPRNQLAGYQAGTTWSTMYGTNANLFRALEDYTVDGTITGALDESKL